MYPNAGLCDGSSRQRLVRNTRGSSYSLCERSRTDPAFPRYPRLPVTSCAGYEAIEWRLPRGHAMTAPSAVPDRMALAAVIAIGGTAGVMLLSGGASADGQKARVTSTDRWLPLAPSPLQRTEVGAARIGRFIYVLGGSCRLRRARRQ